MVDDVLQSSLADRIRRFVYERYIDPAQRRGREQVEVRAGDVHHDMGLVARMPAVCTALGRKFEEEYGVRLLDRRGPKQGANVFFRFQVGSGAVDLAASAGSDDFAVQAERTTQASYPQSREPRIAPTPEDAIILISCVSEKRSSPSPAKDLYISSWFLKARRYAEQTGARWFILSAEYGLVPPDQVIAPYDRTLNTMSVPERRRWADHVGNQLSSQVPEAKHIIFLAGARYREFLAERLQREGVAVEVPMEGLRIGEQLSWLGRT